jgi:hypothetical protein
VLTAIAGDDLAAARRRALARTATEARRTTSTHDLLDQFADLTHAAEAAARRMARAS